MEASIEDASKAITATNEKRLDLAKKLADLRQEKLSLGYTIKGKVQEGYRKALETQNNLKDEIKRLEQSAKSLSVSIENDEENLKKCQELREKLLKEWHEVNDQKSSSTMRISFALLARDLSMWMTSKPSKRR